MESKVRKKLLKGLREKEERLIEAIESIRDMLDDVEDGEISSMGNDFCESLLDFMHESDNSLNGIREFIEGETD